MSGTQQKQEKPYIPPTVTFTVLICMLYTYICGAKPICPLLIKPTESEILKYYCLACNATQYSGDVSVT